MIDDEKETSSLDRRGGAVIWNDFFDPVGEELDAADPVVDVHCAGTVSCSRIDRDRNH